MKTLLIAESQQGRLLENWRELYAFSRELNAASALFLVGDENRLPPFPGKIYLADARTCADYAPKVHASLLLEAIRREQPEMIVLGHTAYGWDLAPRIAYALGAGQASEVAGVDKGELILPVCNGKLRRSVRISTSQAVVTLQSGAFPPAEIQNAVPQVEKIDPAGKDPVVFLGYTEAPPHTVDLSKFAVLVGAGRGVEDTRVLEQVAALAKRLHGEWGATRPLVSAGLADPFRQIGLTGQSAAPRLYLACGISGAVQHLVGVRNASLIVAVNTDKDAPINTAADVLVLADVRDFLPALLQRIADSE